MIYSQLSRTTCPRRNVRIWSCRPSHRSPMLHTFTVTILGLSFIICFQAIRRDGSSGGCCRMAIITKVNINWFQHSFLKEGRKINHPQPTLNRMGWRGSCGWTTSCPSSTRRRNEPSRTFKRNNFTIQYVMCVQRINMLPVPIAISLCDNNLWSIHLENCPKHPCKGD